VPGAPADLLTVYVREAHRRQGHARSLMQMLINAAREAQCPALTLEVRASNTAARTLYESLGFTPIATRPSYYAEPAENGIVYTLNLG
jgi:ribosomal-protein-alanine N-acetyltransferase